MRDFTLKTYKEYVLALKNNNFNFLLFREFIPEQTQESKFCLIRHDIDRKPQNALKMAKLEHEIGVSATYYFRYKPGVFIPEIIAEIEKMGHEVGYHYENLSDANGNYENALIDFEKNLSEFRKRCEVRTVSMHGRPLKPYDNRDLWRDSANHELLKNKFNIFGEVYLDIDYTDIAYINDTGRNWTSNKSNRRDKVESKINADFMNGDSLITYLKHSPHNKIVFQIHPERWSDDSFEWTSQYIKDHAINFCKIVISLVKP